MSDLPIDDMLRDADAAWARYMAKPPGPDSLLGDLSCYIRALAAEVERLEREQAALVDLCVYRTWVRRPHALASQDDDPAVYDERWTSRTDDIAGHYHGSEAEAKASVRALIQGAIEGSGEEG